MTHDEQHALEKLLADVVGLVWVESNFDVLRNIKKEDQ